MPRNWLLATLAIALVLLYLLNLGSAGFLGPDEPRYASIGREMARSGDWITPRLNGSPWFEKPPLLYWTTAVSNRLGLRDEWAARLPLALESLAFMGLFFETLRRVMGLQVAFAATAILATSVGWIAASFAAVTDLPMSVALGAAMLLALFWDGAWPAWIAGGFLGLAILAKGFVPVVLFAPLWLFGRGKRGGILIGAVVVAAPWYALCLERNGSVFWNDFFWKQHVQRALSAEALQHGQAFWYYVPVLLAGLFPWTPLSVLLARGKIYEDGRLRLLALWLLFAFLFFSVVLNKLPFYVLPLMPAFAILLAAALDQVPACSWWIAACVALMIFLPTAASALPQAFLLGATKTAWQFHWSGLIFIPVALAVWLSAKRGPIVGIIAAALAISAGWMYLKWTALPVLDARDSVRAFWGEHQKELGQACIDSGVPRAWQYGLEYYANRALPQCKPAERPRVGVNAQMLKID